MGDTTRQRTHKGKPASTATPLGQVIRDRNLVAGEVGMAAGVYPRTMTEYLAGRKAISDYHARGLHEVLGLPLDLLRHNHTYRRSAKDAGRT